MSLGSFRRFLSLKNELTFWFETKTEHPPGVFVCNFCLRCVCVCVRVTCVLNRSRYMAKGMATSVAWLLSRRIPKTCSEAREASRRAPSWVWTCCNGRTCSNHRLVIGYCCWNSFHSFSSFQPEIITQEKLNLFHI